MILNISNEGTNVLQVNDIQIEGSQASSFTVTERVFEIAPGGQYDLEVTFTPSTSC